MTSSSRKPLARNLGAFFGHIWKAVRASPGRTEVSRRVEEEDRGDVVLRRTTIEEVEIRQERDGETERRRDEEVDPPGGSD